MTVPVPGSLVYTYSADDSTTSFSYPVRFLDKAEIVVILREGVTDTVQVLGTDYTISGSSWPTGGSIVFGTAPASGKTVVIYRNTVPKQLVDLENTQRNDANAVETQLDRLAMVQQDHGRKFEGTWQTRPGETAGTIQSVDDGHILVSDGDGNLVDGGAKSDLATAEQGELADTAVQPGDAEALPTDGADGQVLVRDTSASAGRKWSSIAAGTGDMLSSAYDPAGKGDQVLTVTDAPNDPDLSNDTDKLALRGDVDANLVLQYAADDTALKALDIGSRKAALNLANEDWWLPTSDDISAQITAGDPRYQPTSGDATGASGGWYQAGSIASGQKYENHGARIERIADRMMIGGEAVKFNGLPDGGGGKGGFLWDYLTDESTLTHGWMEQQALLSVGGLYNVDGAVSLNTYLAGPGVALNVHLLHDRSGDVNAASGAWAFYIDARRDLEFGTTWGCELDVINALPSPHTAFGPWGGNGATALGRTTGMQISGGGGPEINGTTYPVDVALLIQKNSTGFYTGIAFGGLSLESDTGTGRMHAIALAPKQAIDWWGDTVAKGILASVVSEVTSASVPQELIFQNGGLGLFCGGNFLFHVDAVADAATYINIHPTGSGGSPAIGAAGTASNISLALRSKGAATSTYLQSDTIATFSATGVASGVNRLDALAAITGSAVQLRALGTDTNIDLQLTPKGSGNVRMGTHTALGSETVTGYITIKDAGGTVRKLRGGIMIYELKLTQQEMQIVGAALGKLPYEIVAPVVKSINEQLAAARSKEKAETTDQPA